MTAARAEQVSAKSTFHPQTAPNCLHLKEFGGSIPRLQSMTIPNQIASHLLRSRIGKICVAIIGSSPDEMVEKATAALKESSFLEFRLDYLPQPAAALPKFRQFFADNGAATAIATCRCKENGGKYDGNSKTALDILLKAAETGFHIVDVELESIEKLPKDTIARVRQAGAAVILSHHDFKGTKNLEAIYRRMEPYAPDFYKIVPTAKSLSDNLVLMRFLESMEDRSNGNIVGISMGEQGIISRVLGLRAGSAFTFAAATTGEETGPGQIAARTLLETYRIEQVDVATKVYGVAGDHIRASLSPLMLNTAFRRETVNSVYLALQTSSAEDLFKLAREVPVQGLSITMPLKETVVPLLERTDPLSAKIGAVNTVLRAQDGKFYGFNTDVAGIVNPLERRLSLRNAKVLVLGAGGAARAAVFGCRDKGAEVWILNRTPETAQKLARQAGAKTTKREAVAKTGFDVIINATPVGMTGYKGAPLLGPEDLNARVVFDLVYNPLETPLLRMARQKGLTAISGVEMFVQQGARQFEIWTGKPAPEDDMLRVVLHSLRQSAEAAGEGPVQSPEAPRTQASTGIAPPQANQGPAAQPAPKAASATAPPRRDHGVLKKAVPQKSAGKTAKTAVKAPAKTASKAGPPAAKRSAKTPAKTTPKPTTKKSK